MVNRRNGKPAELVEKRAVAKGNVTQKAATGIDEVTWITCEHGLCTRLPQLHEEIHTGGYRASAPGILKANSIQISMDGKG
jgi:hypothetical protein